MIAALKPYDSMEFRVRRQRRRASQARTRERYLPGGGVVAGVADVSAGFFAAFFDFFIVFFAAVFFVVMSVFDASVALAGAGVAAARNIRIAPVYPRHDCL